ncbi:MAG: NADH-quinone oxidoreductase subunit L [Phycisphaeraceae bacterium]
MDAAKYIPWLPFLSAVLCLVCCAKKSLRKLAAPICIASIFGAFLIAVFVASSVPSYSPGKYEAGQGIVTAWNWIDVGGLTAGMSYFLDPLTILMLFVVTGIGTLVAIYAAGYMSGDKGYARFFAAVSLFIFAMTTLVMADNLVLLYLGWEGVGLCSFLLIGYYYEKPSAVAAAKKAFIVNRIGDLGFALGIFLTWMNYDTVVLSEIAVKAAHAGVDAAQLPGGVSGSALDWWIPFLLMLGAFGKSAQLPLYVWLPDAMEGPTPVSALIHAATMVTAGVYMIARLIPLFSPHLSPYALTVVAIVGGLTALFAATIALCQYDIKRIFAYSTISQLGYMFLGLGVMSTVGGVFHLFTHAFFKALLFLTAGSVMHALAGQLDLRKMSGLRKKMPVTCWLMFIGCLALAGFPLTAGFFSKDMILADVMARAFAADSEGHLHLTYNKFFFLAILGLFTAFLTAFYTFRLWFRVFLGEEKYEMGDEHGHEVERHEGTEGRRDEGEGHGGHGHEAHGHGDIEVVHHHEPHEMPWLMNGPLVVLALGAIFAGLFLGGWVEHSIRDSTAAIHLAHGEHHPKLLGMDLHTAMMLISSAIAITGILLAGWFHWLNREAARNVAARFPGLVRTLENKWYIDELNDKLIVKPLRLLGEICFAFDRLIIEPLVSLAGFIPRFAGSLTRPLQGGVLQGYGLSMVAGVAILVIIVVWKLTT